jgi:hypothetical protein
VCLSAYAWATRCISYRFLARPWWAGKGGYARRQGQVRLLQLAQRLGHREETVLRGLDYLAASGRLRYRVFDDRIYIGSGGEESGQSGGEALKSLLLETAAYRRFFNQAAAAKIFQLGTSTSA